MLTLSEYRRLRLDALDCPDLDTFIAEVGGSLPASYYEGDDAPRITILTLTNVWNLRNAGIPEIREALGIGPIEFARRYKVPRRTALSWESSSDSGRSAASYLVDLIAVDAVNTLELAATDPDLSPDP